MTNDDPRDGQRADAVQTRDGAGHVPEREQLASVGVHGETRVQRA